MSETRERVLRPGPDDAGRLLEHEDFERAAWTPGYRTSSSRGGRP